MSSCRGRSDGIDQFRGLLVVLVILGHLFEITGQHPFITWLGFGFRMPLFIGLSGYLFNLDRARAEPLLVLAQRYSRIVVPWMVACTVYLSLADPTIWLAPSQLISRPPYHLWFVPVMLVFIIVCRESGLRPRYLLAIAFPVSIVSMYVFGVGHQINQFYDWVPDRRYFIFPLYFVFGVCVSRRTINRELRIACWALTLIGMVWWAYLYRHPSRFLEITAELLLCVPLIYLIPWISGLNIRLAALRAVGRSSLFFYLWHPLVMALWIAAGISDILHILILSLISLTIIRASFKRVPVLCNLLGICTGKKSFLPRGDKSSVELAPSAAK